VKDAPLEGAGLLTTTKRSPTLQRRLSRDRRTASGAKPEKNMLIMKGSVWRNNLNFVNDVPLVCLNFVLILIIVYGENKRHYIAAASCKITLLNNPNTALRILTGAVRV
jgi:hypothetical protein